MKKYEAVFILDPRKVDDEGKAFAGQFEQLINGWGGKMIENVAMGRKTFAREIKKRKAGYYFDFVFEVDPAKEATLRDEFRLDERVLRVLSIVYDRPEHVRSKLAIPEPATMVSAAPAAADAE